ncbi:MAG: DUF2007 domain-containing protein [Deltaproteobacteria bacterium]|nr:DUF2007 domain-containing protein [Deltaproteobacteria bacterium]
MGHNGESLVQINNVERLDVHIKNMTSEDSSFLFHDTYIEPNCIGQSSSILWAILFSTWYGLLEGVLRRLRFLPKGIYLKIWLPARLNVDLHMKIVPWHLQENDSDTNNLHFDSLDKESVNEFLDGGLREVLIKASQYYYIVMNDEFINVGPIDNNMSEISTIIDDIVRGLPVPSEDSTEILDYHQCVENDDGAMIISSTLSSITADLIKLKLLEQGVPCLLIGRGQHNIWGGTTGAFPIKISVPNSFSEKAIEIIELLSANEAI